MLWFWFRARWSHADLYRFVELVNVHADQALRRQGVANLERYIRSNPKKEKDPKLVLSSPNHYSKLAGPVLGCTEADSDHSCNQKLILQKNWKFNTCTTYKICNFAYLCTAPNSTLTHFAHFFYKTSQKKRTPQHQNYVSKTVTFVSRSSLDRLQAV